MVTPANKYTNILEAVKRFRAINQPYEVWLDYEKSKGYVFVKTGYVYKSDNPYVYCILTKETTFGDWCLLAASLTREGYKPVLINSSALKGL